MTVPDLIPVFDVTHVDQQQALKPRRRIQTNKGRRFPPDPMRVDDVVALLEACTPQIGGRQGELAAMRLRALIVILYRTGVRISEALALEESDLRRQEHAIVIKRGKGGKRRTVLMDAWGWRELEDWIAVRRELMPGAIICVIRGRSAGQPIKPADARRQLRDARDRAGLRRRANPHSFRHGFTVESHREGIDLLAIQRQLGHERLDVTEQYLRSLDDLDVLEVFAQRRPPMIVVPPRQR